MKTSIAGMMEIAAHEGIVQMPYRDSVGVWTWGIGHTAAAGAPDPSRMAKGRASPLEEVLDIFRKDLEKYEAGVSAAVTVPLEQHQFDALVSFHYNTGAVGRASFVRKLNAGDVAGAADGMMDWRKPPEIIPRRRREQALFRDSVYASDGFANVYPADAKGRVLWSEGKRMSLTGLFDDPSRPPAPQDEASRPPAAAPQDEASRSPVAVPQDEVSLSVDEDETSSKCLVARPPTEHWFVGFLKRLFGRA